MGGRSCPRRVASVPSWGAAASMLRPCGQTPNTAVSARPEQVSAISILFIAFSPCGTTGNSIKERPQLYFLHQEAVKFNLTGTFGMPVELNASGGYNTRRIPGTDSKPIVRSRRHGWNML